MEKNKVLFDEMFEEIVMENNEESAGVDKETCKIWQSYCGMIGMTPELLCKAYRDNC